MFCWDEAGNGMRTEQEFCETIWKQVLAILEQEVTRPAFETWFESARLVVCNDTNAVIQVPGIFEKNVLIQQYAALICRALYLVLGFEVNLRIVKQEEVCEQNTAMHTTISVKGTGGEKTAALNPRYTFESFVPGSHNRFACAACEGVADNIISKRQRRVYNPLFLYGNVGLGKTHLMHAIGNRILQYRPESKILYLSSETFTNELINAIRNNQSERFREKYRNVDVLLIDDIQFIAKKEATQEEFFHTFNALNDANKQVVITSDRPPKELSYLEERLRSRFNMGLLADVQPPDFETRIAILSKKAQMEKLNVSDEVYAYIAEQITSNVRELEGALLNLQVYAELSNCSMNLDTAKLCLKNIVTETKPLVITGETIQQVVSDYYKVDITALKSKRRTKDIVLPRQIAMYLCRELTDLSLPQIGELFGGRDHTTVLHAYEKIEETLDKDLSMQHAVEKMKEILQC